MNRICIASSGLGRVARGIEAWADDLGNALAARGEQVLLCKAAGELKKDFERVIPCWSRDAAKTRALVRFLPNSLGWRIGMGSGYAVEQLTFAHNLVKVLQAEKIDVLHVQDPMVALHVQKARQRGRLHTRTILAHGTEESLEFQRKITNLQHLAPWHHQEARSAGIDKDTWTTIPNFIDTNHFRPGRSDALRRELGIPLEGFVVLAAAAIKRRHKRVDYLIREFHELLNRMPGAPAWLVVAGGRESETDELVTMANRLLGDRVRCLIQFPRSRMAELYRAANVFTLGSLKEMMPIALLEAAASGLPCLVHRHPVMQWMIGNGGMSLDLSERGTLTRALSDLLVHRDQAERIGSVARTHCVENFSTNVVVDQILRYYGRVANPNKVAA